MSLPRATPESQGIPSAAVLAFLDHADAHLDALHSFMLLRHGRVVAEGWWEPYQPADPHMLFSLSKSFTSTAAGFAIAEGLLTADDPVVLFFPEDLPNPVSPNLAAMRVRHLLSMSTGHAEDTLGPVVRSTDGNWVRSFLACPVEHKPGTHFLYNSGATYLVSAIVQSLTGQTVLDWLTPRLLDPLGITGAFWESCPRGINTGGWGLNLKTEDIARFGQLYLHDGLWEGRRILPAGWVAEATRKHVPNGDDPESDWCQGYGYQFWRSKCQAYRGDGAFGQFCVVLPEADAVVATTSGIGDMQPVLN
ncbi:MAG: serine hydrolase, partial [Armatimonadetes bacterium]|nr:serine hydrolase [Armatimonadota bacterium]